MLSNYTAKYTKLQSGYMGQLIEWPEVVTEGTNFENCRESLKDALQEMILAYQQLDRELPVGGDLFEPMTIEISNAIIETKKYLRLVAAGRS